jgi:hypothetical protein
LLSCRCVFDLTFAFFFCFLSFCCRLPKQVRLPYIWLQKKATRTSSECSSRAKPTSTQQTVAVRLAIFRIPFRPIYCFFSQFSARRLFSFVEFIFSAAILILSASELNISAANFIFSANFKFSAHLTLSAIFCFRMNFILPPPFPADLKSLMCRFGQFLFFFLTCCFFHVCF